MGWGTIYRRRVRVFTLAIVIYLDYKALQHREKWISKSKRDALWKKAHERNARRVLQAMIELEGLWVKLGQYLSTRADVLPNAYITLLKQLQDSLPPRSLQEVFGNYLGSIGLANARAQSKLVGTYETTEMIFMAGGNTKKDLMLKEVCHTIERELGKSMDGLFLKFDKVPLATASIAQVHRATLTNGQEVVVKVQHDGIKTIILEDLKNAKSIVDWIAWAEPQYNFNPMIDEWCKEAPKELDFNNEAENTRTVSRNLGCKIKDTNDNPNKVDVLIPEVIQSTEKVLVLEYMDGIRLNDLASLEACGVDKQKIVEEITRAYAHQIYVDGFFNGDPHPGNFLVSKQPPHFPVLLDFGLTKKLSISMKQALAKMFLASVEGDHVALLSAFAEMGLKLRLDIPEQAMEVTSIFFRSSSPASEALENVKTLSEQRTKNMKLIQEKMRLNQKEVKRFNPVDAFPGDIVIFSRVLNLLRGLSSTMNVRIVYQEIMRPFAEFALQGNIYKEPSVNAKWIYDTPVHCDVEAKLRQLLVELGNDDRILGIQVCAYKDGEVIIDTSAGILGRYDPRPVQPDSLFPVFSVTKGITAGMLHWLVDRGKLQLSENVANIWPEFRTNGKHPIKVHHVLNHTSGLQNALANLRGENPLLLADWDECLNQIAMSIPENEPGMEQLYHYLSFGWLCGGIIEKASGKKFQEVLEEAIVHPLKIEGELYVGIPPGVESRLAALTLDTNDLSKLSEISKRPDLPSTFQPENISEMVTTLPVLFNMLNIRRAIIPAANGHCSARALARYYAALVDGGVVPPPHSSSFKPPLGSHPHIPEFPSAERIKKGKGRRHNEIVTTPKKKANGYEQIKGDDANGYEQIKGDDNDTKRICDSHTRLVNDSSGGSSYASMPYSSGDDSCSNNAKGIFSNLNIHDEFLGVGEYGNLVMANGKFGLGFMRYRSKDGSFTGFGHSGMGGSTGFCDIRNRFAIAVTLNKMSFGTVTRKIMQLVCSELNIPLPEEFSEFDDMRGDVELDVSRPLIN